MYQVLARAIVSNSAPQKIFYEFYLTEAFKWFDALLISLTVCMANLHREVPGARVFTLRLLLQLIAIKIAIFTQLKLIMETSIGFHLGIKLKSFPKI